VNAAILETFLAGQFAAFELVLAPIGSLVAAAPIFGTKAVPMQARALFAVSMSLLILPLVGAAAPESAGSLATFGSLVAKEALLGLLLGLGVSILLSGAQLTGQVISQLGGTAIAEGFDAVAEENLPVYSQFFYALALAMFVLLDGHRLLTEALLDTYARLPPGKAELGDSFVAALAMLLGQSFMLGIRAAAPAMAALLLATLILGLIGRTLPQINILVVGFSINALLTAGCLCITIGAIAWAFPQQTAAAIELLSEAFESAVGQATGTPS
jgi:flagellar biosynthetic protein FliR